MGFGGGMMGNGGGGFNNMPYGYGNMMPMNNRPNDGFWVSRRREQDALNFMEGKLTYDIVQTWLKDQPTDVLQQIATHCQQTLEKKSEEKNNKAVFQDWYKEEGDSNKKSGTLLEGGVEGGGASKTLKRDHVPKQGWSRSDMRHPHKVVHQMKPLPDLEIIPPFSVENKEADIDRDKRKMLQSNVNMMQIEVNKICHKFKIVPSQLDKENLDQYPEQARAKLKMAVNCVKNAETTLSDFLDFLKTEKYKAWNDDQISKRDALLKSMIGETPKGTPHASGIREEDIELVDRKFEDGLDEEEKTQDELDGDPAEPVEKAAKKDPIKFTKASN